MTVMRRLMYCASLALIIFCVSYCKDSEAASKNMVISGTIFNLDCEGDICLLAVKDEKGEVREGLCSDPRFNKWLHDCKSPDAWMGKKVRVTVEKSKGGEGLASENSFIKIDVLNK